MKLSINLFVILMLTTLFVSTHQLGFKPFSAEKLRDIELICMKLLRQPIAFWYKYLNLEYPDDPITHCHLRCIGISTGLYGDEFGAHLDNIYEQFKENTLLNRTAWMEEKNNCLAKQFADGLPDDLCKRTFLTFKCFEVDYLLALSKSDCSKISI
ncbi:AAEL007014-PA [Aedes aegypti]|uniref:AAEL007014-PA n=1 Tax=Aedes aegypti TaxID=7159 RepID=Q173T3_AEDAE|nr:AAEL007014-PA [Aedes aegypti]